ncbi:MAG TPA: hypothetical protein VMA13_00165 [Candidatus Saccharimonadales bacterium]|nr:hypothetical protein [Candidatus Saccharimonadales bacterium]
MMTTTKVFAARSQLYLIACVIWAAAGLAYTACGQTGLSPANSPSAKTQQQLDWELKTTVGAYEKIGRTNSAWDAPAKRALAEYALIANGVSPDDMESISLTTDANVNREDSTGFLMDDVMEQIVATNSDAAIKAGCDDPFVQYLHARFYDTQFGRPKVVDREFRRVALEMQKSSYPAEPKFYAAERAFMQGEDDATNATAISQKAQIAQFVQEDLLAVLQDKTTPPDEAYIACVDMLNTLNWEKDDYIKTYSLMEPLLFSNWPNDSVSWLLKGIAHIQMGWNAHFGDNFGGPLVLTEAYDSLTREDQNNNPDFAIAEESLNRAWELNPKDARVADEMMQLEMARGGLGQGMQVQGAGRARLETWFDRAMKDDPNDYAACFAKLTYLHSKWYGSDEEMLKFGRECVANTNWGGDVPLILLDTHFEIYINESKKMGYWKQPKVWQDVKAAYDRYIQANPDATDIYRYYAVDAYFAGQWKTFLKLAPKVDAFGYGLFGGKNNFDKTVQYARRMERKQSRTAPAGTQ